MRIRLLAAAAALVAATLALPPTATATTTTYTVDPTHSDVGFSVRHLISKVRGEFTDFSADIVKNDADPAASRVDFRVRVASVDTGNEKRDDHLRSPDFFDASTHPEIVFQSRRVEKLSANEYRVTGDLTLRGVTKVVTLPVSFGGELTDPWGNVKAGFSTSIVLDRQEFGINWNQTLDQGGVMLGDEVRVDIDLQVKKTS